MPLTECANFFYDAIRWEWGLSDMTPNYWVTKGSNGWVVKKQGSSRAASIHSTQSEAWAETRRLARGAGGDAILKGSNGKIQAENSYKDHTDQD